MKWTTPSLVEIKMDAEIGSYQSDDEPNPVGTGSTAVRGLPRSSPIAGPPGPDDSRIAPFAALVSTM